MLLLASDGSLYTEGYAHDGKVLLYDCNEGRPDRLRKLWHHLDRFGHARRYLNWNPSLNGGVSLEKICYSVPMPEKRPVDLQTIVESEAKYRVTDPTELDRLLRSLAFAPSPPLTQRDEYYDTADGTLKSLDYAIRLRKTDAETVCAFKGPRLWTGDEYARIEFELAAKTSESAVGDLRRRGLHTTWYFEKRRTSYRSAESSVNVEVDEIPEIGFFVEIEGSIPETREIAIKLAGALGEQERRNYQEIYLDFKIAQGFDGADIEGASFH